MCNGSQKHHFFLSVLCIIGLCLYGARLYADVVPRDPTEPFNSEVDSITLKGQNPVTEYILEAILISGIDKFAIINNKRVKVGDTVGARKVKKIDSYEVILEGETGEIVLALFGDPIKKSIQELAK